MLRSFGEGDLLRLGLGLGRGHVAIPNPDTKNKRGTPHRGVWASFRRWRRRRWRGRVRQRGRGWFLGRDIDPRQPLLQRRTDAT